MPIATQVRRWFVQALGAAILAATGWQALGLLSALPRYYGSPTFWLELGTNLAFWLPCWAGGIALLRGCRSAFWPLYVPAVLLVMGGLVVFFKSLYPLLGPPRYEWPVGLATLALLAVTHGLTRRSLVAGPVQPGLPRWGWAGVAITLFALYAACSYGRQGLGEEAGERVNQATVAYEEGRPDEALEEWGHVIDRYPYTSAWGVAVFNTGVYYKERGRYQEAITRFESLLGSKVNDRDPSRNLMQVYQNYRDLACLEISSCYEELEDYRSALRYAVLARDAYPFQSWCGNCRYEAKLNLAQRIKRLEEAGNTGESRPGQFPPVPFRDGTKKRSHAAREGRQLPKAAGCSVRMGYGDIAEGRKVMSLMQVEVQGTLHPDGTLVLDEKPNLPPGKVRVVVQPVPEVPPAHEDWWQCLQRLRARREAAGYPFLDERQMAEHLDWLHDEDDRIDRLYREIEQERRRHGLPPESWSR
jgi:tetratricopeptide (TPR) repeat protein